MKRYALISGVIVVLDQITKWLAVGSLTRIFAPASPGGVDPAFGERVARFLTVRHPGAARAIPVIPDFWHFRYAENTGAAFSLLAGAQSWVRTGFLLAVSVVAMIFIVGYFKKTTPDQRFLRFSLALVFGGAIGNFIDRARLGYVIDFIDWHWYQRATWPTFNVADSAITVGVCCLLLDMWLFSGAHERRRAESSPAGS